MLKDILSYILSHHEPKDYNRCLSLTVAGNKYNICSRCAGWYSSFLFFWILLAIDIDFLLNYNIVIIFLFPIPAIFDWSLHKFKIYKGTNASRFITGLFLGLAFATILYIFFRNPFDPLIWIVSLLYTTIIAIIFHFTR